MHAFPLQGSGEITYDELCEVVRHKLRVSSTAMPDNAIKALWCALDADDSNQLTMSEFGKFLKLGDKPQLKKLKSWGSSGTGAKSLSEMSAINNAIESTPTAEMRKELEGAGVGLPASEELKTLSTRFNAWLEELRYNLGLPASHTYANLFATVDEDVRYISALPRPRA